MLARFRPTLHTLDDRITPTLAFANQQTFAAGSNPSAVAVGDFNQDGRPDIATVNGAGMSVLLNTTPAGSAAATFATQQSFAVDSGPVAVAVGDINGDGRADIVTANLTAGTVSVLLNTTELGATVASFATGTSFTVPTTSGNFGTRVYDIKLIDFNGDGRLDVATAGVDAITLNTTPLGASTATFAAPQNLGGYSTKLAVADFNLDGRSDLVSLNTFYPVFYLNNTTSGASTATVITQSLSTPSIYANYISVGDTNGDGRPDLILGGNVPGPYSPVIGVFSNQTLPGATYAAFDSGRTFSIGGQGADVHAAPVVGDFDSDGRADVAAVNVGNTIAAIVNQTPAGTATPTFSAPASYATGAGTNAAVSADFNGDGRLDLAAPNRDDGTLSVLVNASTASAVTGPVLVAQFGTTGVWRYNRVSGAWDQLTASNATSLATAANGNVIAAFGSAGVWYYTPAGGWAQMNSNAANVVAIDALGNAAVSFPGFGTALYRPSYGGAYSYPFTSATADQLAMNARGDVVASFAGYGVWKLSQGEWKQLDTHSAAALALAGSGDVAASFAGYGVNLYRASAGWSRINGVDATSLSIDGGGSVVANFPGYGLARYIGYAGGWQTVAPATQASGVAADWGGHVYASFGGFGVWEYSYAYGWQQRRGNDANTFAVG